MFSKRPKRKPAPMPVWLKWTLLVFLLYVLAQSQNPHSRVHDALNQASSQLHSSAPDTKEYKEGLFPSSPKPAIDYLKAVTQSPAKPQPVPETPKAEPKKPTE